MTATKKKERTFDWVGAREQLARAIEHTEASLANSSEHAAEILEARARALARVPEPPRRQETMLTVVAFTLAGERYAIETRFVREVVRFTNYVPLPETPEFVIGAINLRGKILVVVDLGKLFGLPQRGLTDLSRAIILGVNQAEFGVVADETEGIADIALDDLHEPTGVAVGIGRDFVMGTTPDAWVALNGAALLSDGRLFIGQHVKPGA